jgi:hypothetical protein
MRERSTAVANHWGRGSQRLGRPPPKDSEVRQEVPSASTIRCVFKQKRIGAGTRFPLCG